MSTNGRTESVRGLRVPPLDEEGKQIKPGELGFPIQHDAWQVWGFEDPDVLEYRRAVPLEDLHKMTQRDGHARMLLNLLQWPMRAARVAIEPDQDGDEEADFIKAMLFDPPHKGGMTTTFDYVMACLSLAFRDGFAVLEKVVEIRGGMQVLRKLSPRPARSIVFQYDDHGGLKGVVQRVWYKGEEHRIRIPVEKLLLWTVGKEIEPLQGESLFLPAYYHYDKKHRLYYIAHVAAQVGAVPLRVGKVPGGQSREVLNYFRELLEKLGLQGALAVPAGWEVETHSGQSILGDILELIEHHDMSMSKSILAQFVDVGTEGKGNLGTATTTSELGDLFVVALEAHLKDIAQHITSYVIPYFVDVNFGSGRYPTFRFEPFTDEQKDMIKEAFTALYNATSPPAPEMMFQIAREYAEALGLEGIDWDSLEKRMQEEWDQQDAVKKLELKVREDQLKNPPDPASGGAPGLPLPGGRPVPPGGRALSRAALAEFTAPSSVARSIRLAEAAMLSDETEVGIDAYGYALTPGAIVHELDEPGKFYRVRRVAGGRVQVEEFESQEAVDKPFEAARLVYVS